NSLDRDRGCPRGGPSGGGGRSPDPDRGPRRSRAALLSPPRRDHPFALTGEGSSASARSAVSTRHRSVWTRRPPAAILVTAGCHLAARRQLRPQGLPPRKLAYPQNFQRFIHSQTGLRIAGPRVALQAPPKPVRFCGKPRRSLERCAERCFHAPREVF